MEQKKSNRGGKRPNAGRKKCGRDVTVCIKISRKAYEILKKVSGKSKSAFIDKYLLNLKK